jgi:hypothetical protein
MAAVGDVEGAEQMAKQAKRQAPHRLCVKRWSHSETWARCCGPTVLAPNSAASAATVSKRSCSTFGQIVELSTF